MACTAKAQDNAGLRLPAGFSATLFANNIGSSRHITITPSGVVFAKLNAPNKEGKAIVRLEDTNKDGIAEKISGWGEYGGTGIYVRGQNLYASSDQGIFLYQLNDQDEVINPTSPKVIVKDLLDRRQHSSKSITLDPQGNIYVNMALIQMLVKKKIECQVQKE